MRWLLALFLVPGVLWAQGAWRDPFIVYQEAQAAAVRGDFMVARQRLEELSAQKITPPGFFVLYGIVLFGGKDFVAAQAAFAQALLENPNDAQALFYTGLLYTQQNKNKEAKKFLQRALEVLPTAHELRPAIYKLLQGLDAEEEQTKPPRLHALASFSTQADTNAKLTPDEAASDAAGARFLLQLAGSFAQPITKKISIEASGGGLLSLPFINAEVLRELDPSVVFSSLSIEAKNKKENLFGGASFTGKLYGLEEFQQLFMQEASALFLAQVGAKRSARAVYRATLSNFVLSEDTEGTSFDQDSFQQEGSLSLRSSWGGLASFLYTQAEADGNSFDRRGFMLQAGIERLREKLELRASVDGGVVLFPNTENLRQDLRASLAAQASTPVRGVVFSVSYQGALSDSSDEAFSYVRHLFTLGARWQR